MDSGMIASAEKWDAFIEKEISRIGVNDVIFNLAFYLQSLAETHFDKTKAMELVKGLLSDFANITKEEA